jgi:fructose-bisphosphate aldolase class 1
MGVMILCHHSTINIIIDCIERKKKKFDQSLNERKIILDFINQLNSTRFYIKGIIMMNQFVIDGKKK